MGGGFLIKDEDLTILVVLLCGVILIKVISKSSTYSIPGIIFLKLLPAWTARMDSVICNWILSVTHAIHLQKSMSLLEYPSLLILVSSNLALKA